MDLQWYDSPKEIPEDVSRFWTRAAATNFFLSRWWFETVAAAGLDAGDRSAVAVLYSSDGLPSGLLPGRFIRSPLLGRVTLSEFRSLTGMYTCYFRPIVGKEGSYSTDSEALGTHLGASLGRGEIIHFDALDSGWPDLPAFERGLERAGLRVERYDHFGNWSEDMRGRTFDRYLQDRDGALRETLRRRSRTLERAGSVSYAIASRAAELEEGIAAYDTVYRQSWKEPEPYPDFQPLLMRNACREGALRLGICRLDGKPIAAQLWIVWHGSATLLKLAHAESASKLSVGSILTAQMIRRVTEEDGATRIDFGRGDDPYKSRWTTRREQRIGLLAANPASAKGLAVLARQFAGRWRRQRQARTAS